MVAEPKAARTLDGNRPLRKAPLYWLALGTFAVGTEGFMIAALLPGIAKDLSVSLQAAGYLVTAFAFTYALSSPLLAVLTGGFNRRKLLVLSMAVFAVSNVMASVASGYWSLLAARVLLAIAAGFYVPAANADAAMLVPLEWRGRALAIVNGGLTLAVALGVPLGALLGAHFGWRSSFVGVAVLAAAALTGLLVGMPRAIGAGLTVATLRERLAIVRLPGAFPILLVTTLWAIGTYTVYTYIAAYLSAFVGFEGVRVGYVLFLWGTAALLGLVLGGLVTDKVGGRYVIGFALPLLAVALTSLSAIAWFLSPTNALVPVLVAVFVWGLTAWGFFPAQQARLIGVAGLKGASVILSLNATFMYLGFSLGAALGSLTLTIGTVADIGWVGGALVVASFSLCEWQRSGSARAVLNS